MDGISSFSADIALVPHEEIRVEITNKQQQNNISKDVKTTCLV